MIEVVDTVPIEVFDMTGQEDEFAHAALAEEGIFLDPVFMAGVGLRWEDLATLLEHPYVQERLEDVKMERGT